MLWQHTIFFVIRILQSFLKLKTGGENFTTLTNAPNLMLVIVHCVNRTIFARVNFLISDLCDF